MRQCCEKCGCSYNDEVHSTTCPHRGIGFCAVCDCTICVCTPETAGERWERSTAASRIETWRKLAQPARIRGIQVRRLGTTDDVCRICGKFAAKRIGKSPAPIFIILTFDGARISGNLCMACAKRISSRLDTVIEQIESKYQDGN